ncbi:ankyrin repeat-containing domain protein [Ilyonectria destructans]|nr:ankyrin repeat-containing domain protein [Ilyonectria destructans]
MPLARLPSELLAIIGQFCSRSEQNELTRVNHQFHNVFNPVLYRQNLLRDAPAESCTFWAARNGRLDTLKLAVAHGADINDNGIRNEDDWTRASPSPHFDPRPVFASPLHLAIYHRRPDIIAWLLDNDADFNTPSRNVCLCYASSANGIFCAYPLHTAICSGDESTVRLLLSRGAIMSTSTVSALFCGIRNGCLPVVDAFIQKPDFDPNEEIQGMTALHHAALCREGHVAEEVVHRLVDRGVPVDAVSNDLPPLAVAVSRRHFNVVLALIDRGADTSPLFSIDIDASALHWFLKYDYLGPRVPTLSRYTREERGRKIRESEEGRAGVVSRLIALGADLEVKGDPQRFHGTPLYYAAAYAIDPNCVQILLDAGARVDATVDYEVHRGFPNEERHTHTILYGILRVIFAPSIIPRRGRDFQRSKDAIRLLLQHGARLDSLGGEESALQLACRTREFHDTGVLERVLNNSSAINTSLEHIEEVLRACGTGDQYVATLLTQMHERVRKATVAQ